MASPAYSGRIWSGSRMTNRDVKQIMVVVMMLSLRLIHLWQQNTRIIITVLWSRKLLKLQKEPRSKYSVRS